MSIKIRHGPPGSYKTSGSIEDLLVAAKQNRHIITNIRGLDEDKLRALVPAAAFTLENIDTSVEEGKEKLRRFWHWAQAGSYIHIDEAQMIFPPRWRDSEFKKFDYPAGADAAAADGRAFDFFQAFEMHRHYNYDFTLTTPDVSLIHKHIRACSEVGYKHWNTAVFGVKGRFIELQHPALQRGSRSDIISTRVRKIPQEHFKVYGSTTTGEVTDTQAGLAIWKNPKVMILGGVFLVLLAGTISRGLPSFMSGESTSPVWGKASAPGAAPAGAAPAVSGVRPYTPPAGIAPAAAVEVREDVPNADPRLEGFGPLHGQAELTLAGTWEARLPGGRTEIQPILRRGGVLYAAPRLREWGYSWRWDQSNNLYLRFRRGKEIWIPGYVETNVVGFEVADPGPAEAPRQAAETEEVRYMDLPRT